MTRRILLGGLGATVAFELLDGCLGPEVDDRVWAELTHAWDRCRAAAGGTVAETVRARLGGKPADGLVVHDDPAQLLTASCQMLTHAFIRTGRGRLLMLHAGGVSNPTTGASLVFVAPGGTGKSTLARALGRDLAYLSDETIGIDADGTILPYPKPISMVPTPGTGPKKEVSPDDLGLRPVAARPWVHRLVLLRRDPTVTDVRVETLHTVDAISQMTAETSSLCLLQRPLHRISDLLAATGGAQRWTYAEHTDLLARAAALVGAA